MSIVIGIDPGAKTGYVVINSADLEIIDHTEIDNWFEVGVRLEKDLKLFPKAQVVIERFIINAQTHKKGVQDEPRDLIGTCKWLALKYTVNPAVMQTASEAKTFSTNDKLKAVGFWHKGGKGHANDAFRHAMLYMVKNSLLDPRLLVQ